MALYHIGVTANLNRILWIAPNKKRGQSFPAIRALLFYLSTTTTDHRLEINHVAFKPMRGFFERLAQCRM